MAQIEKRSNSWRVRIRRFGFPSVTKTFTSKEVAQKWAKQIEVEMDRGAYLDRSEAERTLLADLVDRYTREISSEKRGGKSEIIRLKAFMRHPMCALRVSAVTSQHIASFRDDRLKVVSPSTVLRDLSVLAHIFEISMREWGIHLPKNPVRAVRKPKPNRSRDRRLALDEEVRLFEVLSKPCRNGNGRLVAGITRNVWMVTVCRLALETGMRQAEIVSLQWQNLNLERSIALLPITKNGEKRIVPLSKIAVDTLRELPRSIDGSVFPGLTCEAVKRAFSRAVHFAGLEDLKFHDLRHEATTRFFEKGLSIMEVAAITGHKTIQMLSRYTHLRAEDLARKLN